MENRVLPMAIRWPWSQSTPTAEAVSSTVGRLASTSQPPALADAATLTPGLTPAVSSGGLMRRGRTLAIALSMLASAGMPLAAVAAPAASNVAQTASPSAVMQPAPILTPDRFLKADFFPSVQSPDLPVTPGAPNFREIANEPIYGVAQPTVDGIKTVLDKVGAGPHGTKTAVWTNLRQEPVVYINGQPYNPRQSGHPFDNLQSPGATTADVEASDEQLKREVLRMASRNGGVISLSTETPDGRVVAHNEPVRTVQTVKEVYQQLQAQGYRVDYARIPIGDEKAPDDNIVDALVTRLKNVNPDSPEIFNCHAGRGRTTTGEVVADLMRRARTGSDASITRSAAVRQDIQETGDYQAGNYRVILRLIGALEGGGKDKSDADGAIDEAGAVQNLRTAIDGYRKEALDPSLSPDKQAAALARGQDYLKRYFYLVAIDAYVKEQAPKDYGVGFGQWMDQHHLHDMLGNLQLAMNGANLPAFA